MSRLWSALDFFNKNRRKKAESNQDDSALFVQHYQTFREILDSNHQVLATMADMQEKAGGVYAFDSAYVHNSCRKILDGVETIVGKLNLLSGDRYNDLVVAHQACTAAIQDRLDSKITIPEVGPTIELEKLSSADIPAAGGKIAQLGELDRTALGEDSGLLGRVLGLDAGRQGAVRRGRSEHSVPAARRPLPRSDRGPADAGPLAVDRGTTTLRPGCPGPS